MRMRNLGLLAAAALVSIAPLARAIDAPHDQTFSTGTCDNCHAMYQTTASGAKDFSPGCVSCHNGLTSNSAKALGFPWVANTDQAKPGLQGSQHSWSGYAKQAGAGAAPPALAALASKLIDGKLQCAVCHDLHTSTPTYTPDRITSVPVGGSITSGAGTLTLVTAGPSTKAWRIKIQAGGTYIISHDFGLATPTWLNYVGGTWQPGTDPGTGKGYTVGANETLDDGATVVKLGGTLAAGNFFDLYVAYPLLRYSMVSNAFCYLCHQERVMDHVRAGGRDPNYPPNGSNVFSHPVSVALNQNGGGYDRTDLLDANGKGQSVGDGKTTNDLALDGGQVRCTTCHAIHNGRSNSL